MAPTGRASKKSIIKSFAQLEKAGTKWHLHGYAGLVGNYCLMMFYTTVAGWMLYSSPNHSNCPQPQPYLPCRPHNTPKFYGFLRLAQIILRPISVKMGFIRLWSIMGCLGKKYGIRWKKHSPDCNPPYHAPSFA